MNHKWYYEKIIDEILKLLKDNLILLYNYNEDALLDIKKYCKDKIHKRYIPLQYDDLIYFTEIALAELSYCDNLYDFRDLD